MNGDPALLSELVERRANLSADYDATMKIWSQLVEIRFRLLALAPIATGLGVKRTDPPTVAMLGLMAAAGVIVYEMRNSQLHDNAVHRLKWLEDQRGLQSSVAAVGTGGAITDTRSGRPLRTVGGFRLVHDRALGVIYGGVTGAWAWRLALGVATRWWSGQAVSWSAVGAGVVVALGTLATIVRVSERGRVVEPLSDLVRRLELKPGATVADDFNKAINAAAGNARTTLTAALTVAEQLGLVENRPVVGRRRRVKAGTDWWTTAGAVENGAVRRGLVRRRGRAVVHVRPSSSVRPRLTPWGDLWLAQPAPGTRSAVKRTIALLTYLGQRITGFDAFLTMLRMDRGSTNGWRSKDLLAPAAGLTQTEVDGLLDLLTGAGAIERDVTATKEDVVRLLPEVVLALPPLVAHVDLQRGPTIIEVVVPTTGGGRPEPGPLAGEPPPPESVVLEPDDVIGHRHTEGNTDPLPAHPPAPPDPDPPPAKAPSLPAMPPEAGPSPEPATRPATPPSADPPPEPATRLATPPEPDPPRSPPTSPPRMRPSDRRARPEPPAGQAAGRAPIARQPGPPPHRDYEPPEDPPPDGDEGPWPGWSTRTPF